MQPKKLKVIPIYVKSEIARLYYKELGRDLPKEKARLNFAMVRNYKVDILEKILRKALEEQIKELKKL